jgi:hypothetical protein
MAVTNKDTTVAIRARLSFDLTDDVCAVACGDLGLDNPSALRAAIINAIIEIEARKLEKQASDMRSEKI